MIPKPSVSMLFPVTDPTTGQRYHVKVTLAHIANRLAVRLDCDRPISAEISEAIHDAIRSALGQDGIGLSHVVTLQSPADFPRLMGGGLG